MGTFTIGKLAEAAGVNVETVRYYERRGLLEQPPRPGQGYRQYSDADVWRLQFIRRGKDLGFTLAEIADLLGPDGERSSDAIRRAARAKIDLVDQRIGELGETRPASSSWPTSASAATAATARPCRSADPAGFPPTGATKRRPSPLCVTSSEGWGGLHATGDAERRP